MQKHFPIHHFHACCILSPCRHYVGRSRLKCTQGVQTFLNGLYHQYIGKHYPCRAVPLAAKVCLLVWLDQRVVVPGPLEMYSTNKTWTYVESRGSRNDVEFLLLGCGALTSTSSSLFFSMLLGPSSWSVQSMSVFRLHGLATLRHRASSRCW